VVLHQIPAFSPQGGEGKVAQNAVGDHVDGLSLFRERFQGQQDLAELTGHSGILRMSKEPVRQPADPGRWKGE
jgi:hypothetical protein